MKLKMEFRILNQLTEIAQERLRSSQAYFSDSLVSPLGTSNTGTNIWSEKGNATLELSRTPEPSTISPGATPKHSISGPSGTASRRRSVQIGEVTGFGGQLAADGGHILSMRRRMSETPEYIDLGLDKDGQDSGLGLRKSILKRPTPARVATSPAAVLRSRNAGLDFTAALEMEP
jgi:hypothetical protein